MKYDSKLFGFSKRSMRRKNRKTTTDTWSKQNWMKYHGDGCEKREEMFQKKNWQIEYLDLK